jgi:hypothetical protein
VKEIQNKKREVNVIKEGIEEVQNELKNIKENEQEYLRL